ncbi:MAG: hypothetical protein A2Z32_06995 [Chloroflexi bacterium RBG_16_69_14]|nr:MAG: hypothetical protein A2Z32_06995 [Chloroflexi bacterium RBG_16_69_14]
MDATTKTTLEAVNPRAPRRRRVLSGIALVLAVVTILVTTVALWVHQVAFNTDRFTALVVNVVDEPALIDPLSAAISTQVVEALDVEARIEERLPGPTKPLAGALTLAVRDAIDKRLQVALANPRIQQALIKTLSFSHAAVMKLLRAEPDAVSVVDGYVVIEVFPVVEAALTELQAIGLIPEGVQIPDLSTPEAPGVLSGRIASALGITLPADFGTIQLMPADRLLTARSLVRAFDLFVVALIVLSVILVALALWLSSHRRRMVIYLGVGTIIAFLLARLAVNTFTDALISGIADEGLATGVRTVVDATVEDLRRLTTIILVATGIVAIAAYLWGRPKWVVAVTSQASDAAGRAGTKAAAAGSAGLGAAAASRPSRASLEGTVRDNRASVERIGLSVVIFIVAWIALGLEIALVGAALVVGFELVLRAIASPADADGEGEAADKPAPEA